MKDSDSDGVPLRQLIMEAVEKCTDTSLLDLVYKVLVCSA